MTTGSYRPPGDRLLWLCARIVPASARAAWLREWRAELHSTWGLDGPRRRSRASAYLRCAGALEDAWWLRLRRQDTSMLLQDLRYALRSFRLNPGFTVVVVVTLALGIGANSAIFSLVDATLLRPLPVMEPEELVDIYTSCRRGFAYCTTSYPDYEDYRDQNRTFTDVAAFTGTELTLTEDGSTRFTTGWLATGNYFGLLGIQMALGRPLLPGDDVVGSAGAVAVLSHRSWRADFGSDPEVLGRTIRLNDAPFTVVGVAPAGFRGTRLSGDPDLWIPFSALSQVDSDSRGDILARRDSRWIGGVIGRRAPGVSIDQVRADLNAVSDGLQAQYPTRAGRTITAEPVRSYSLPASSAEDIVRFVYLLMAVVVAALLIACANIANLLLARATARRREIAVRIALGAGRRRLMRQLLTESVLLAGTGAALGLGVAAFGLQSLSGYALPGFVSIGALQLGVDTRVLVFTGLVAVFTGIAFGVAPAWHGTRTDLTDALKDQTRDRRAGSAMRIRSVLLSFQSALALVLLIGAGLFVRSLRNGLASDVGFSTRNLAVVGVDLSQRYDEAGANRFIDDILERARHLPTVRDVTVAVWPPLARGGSGFFIGIDGYQPTEGEELRIEANWVGANYFRAMGIPLLSGRDILETDRVGSPRVAVINTTMAHRWWPDTDPVGRGFRLGGPEGEEVRIVGVAGDVKDGLSDAPEPFVFYAARQFMGSVLRGGVHALVATNAEAVDVLPMLRQHVKEIDPDLPLAELATLQDRFADALMPQRMGSTLLSTLGLLTVLLAAIGISGVVAYGVNRRIREIGIRLALGANRSHVLTTVVRGAMLPVVVGLAIGLGVAGFSARLIANFMYGIEPTDVMTFAALSGAMGSVALVAAILPARRAARINPTEALKAE